MSTKKNLRAIILIGLPASGKSTWAQKFMSNNENFVKVGRDEFRFMLKNSPVCEPKIESLITDLMDNVILQSLKRKQNIIIDNTNLKQGYINHYIDLVEYYADVEFMFFDVPAVKCIERDKLREKAVGEQVINKMNEDFIFLKGTFDFQNIKMKPIHLRPFIRPSMNVVGLKNAVIFDIDGTLALMKGRGPFEFNKVFQDDLNDVVAEHIKFHKDAGREIIVVSGRDAVCRKETEDWLEFYHIQYDHLFMRPKDDGRKDSIIKHEIFENNIKDKYNVICVYDDRLDVLNFWYGIGMFTFNVNQGNLIF